MWLIYKYFIQSHNTARHFTDTVRSELAFRSTYWFRSLSSIFIHDLTGLVDLIFVRRLFVYRSFTAPLENEI